MRLIVLDAFDLITAPAIIAWMAVLGFRARDIYNAGHDYDYRCEDT